MRNIFVQEKIDISKRVTKNDTNVEKKTTEDTESLKENSDMFDDPHSCISVCGITNEQFLMLFNEMKEKKTNPTVNRIADFLINNEIIINTQSFSTTVRKKPAHIIGRRY